VLSTPAAPPTALLGSWSLHRRVVDRASGLLGRVQGTLLVTTDGPDLRWVEQGTLTWPEGLLPVTRELRITPHRCDWLVCFADGREFHPWRPGQPVMHQCRADTYRGFLVVDAGWTRLRICWDVIGPTKQQRLFTRCLRLDVYEELAPLEGTTNTTQLEAET
jgi:hypothetical protein